MRRSWGADFDRYTQDNVLPPSGCWKRRCGRKASSGSSTRRPRPVYGDAVRYPTEETDRPQPLSPYGVTKLAAEHLCSLYAENYGLPTVSLRYFTVYGPRQRPDMAFTRFCRASGTRRRSRCSARASRSATSRSSTTSWRRTSSWWTTRSTRAGRVQRGGWHVDHGQRGLSSCSAAISGGQPRVNRGAGPWATSCGPGEHRGHHGGHRVGTRCRLREGLEEQYRWVAGVLT